MQILCRMLAYGAILALAPFPQAAANDAASSPGDPLRYDVQQGTAVDSLKVRMSTATVTPLKVNTSSRAEARIFHAAIHPASDSAVIAWTGNIDTGVAGTTASAFREAVRLRVNYFRAFAGIPAAITFNSTFNLKAQKAALMMAANKALSHYPPVTWRFYTADGAEAAQNSDLYLGEYGPASIDGYIDDPGSNNTVVGHRRWILYPQTEQMGTGDVPASGQYQSSNVLWVIDSNAGGTRPATRDAFVAWPPPGYIPNTAIYARWSFAYPDADFSAATVSMSRGSTTIPTVIESRANGYGENTIVWVPTLGSVVPSLTADVAYTVTVAGVKIGGVSQKFVYVVRSFHPASKVGESAVMGIGGDSTPAVGATTLYTVSPLSFATLMQARVLKRNNMTWTEGAEGTSYRVVLAKDASYTGISTAVKYAGTKSFQLAHPTFEDQSLTTKNQIIPASTASVSFYSRLRYATSSQVARLQVSPDDGSNWFTLWSQAGSNGSGETAFSLKTVSLADFAGKPVKVRLLYDYVSGSAYTSTDSAVGWFVDNLKFAGCQELTSAATLPSTGNWSFSFTPTVVGTYYLQTRPKLFNKYYGAWESGKSISTH